MSGGGVFFKKKKKGVGTGNGRDLGPLRFLAPLPPECGECRAVQSDTSVHISGPGQLAASVWAVPESVSGRYSVPDRESWDGQATRRPQRAPQRTPGPAVLRSLRSGRVPPFDVSAA